MASLYFKVNADWEKVVKLREEISRLESQLKRFGSSMPDREIKATEAQLGSARQEFTRLTTEAAKAGAEIEGGFKKKIYDASQVVNNLTEEIIKQKRVIAETKDDIRSLSNQYATMSKYNKAYKSVGDELKMAKNALSEQQYALFELTQQQAEARLSVKKLRDEYALFKEDSDESRSDIDAMADSMKDWAAKIAGGIGIKEFISKMIQVRSEFQAADTAIQTLLGSKEKADELMSEVREYAKISPLEFSDVTQATQMMLGFNIEAEKVPKFIAAIGDVSMGESQKFNSLTLAFSQMSAAGKLMGQDLNQMINAGFNPLQTMSEKTGKSISELKDEMSKGAISAEMVQQAFIDATSAGGKFFNMSENASKTMQGQFSMLSDAIDAAFNGLGQKAEGAVIAGTQAVTNLVENYETIGKIIAGLTVTYGAYRTAVLLTAAAESKLTGIIQLASKAQALLNASMLANPFVLLTTAIVGCAAAMWAFRDSATEAEKAQERFNKRQEESVKQEQEHKQRIDSLVDSSRDIALADSQRGRSLAELRKEYPKIFEKYDIETIKLADILKLKRQIAEEDSRRAEVNKAKELSGIESEISRYETLLKRMSGQQGVDGYVKKLKELRADREVLLQERGKGISERFVASLKDIDISELDRYVAELEKRIKGAGQDGKIKMRLPIDVKGSLSDEAIYNVRDIRALIDSVKSSKQTRIDSEKNKTTYKQDYEKAKRDWEEAKKKLSEIEKDKSRFTSKQYEEARKREEDAEKAFKNLGGSAGHVTSNSMDSYVSRYSSLSSKQALEQERAIEDLQMQVDEARIEAMDEGSKKVLAEMELNFEKEMQAIDRQKEDALRKKIENARAVWESDPKNKGKLFDGSGIILSDKENGMYDILYKNGISSFEKSLKQYQEKQDDAWNEYYIRYGKYQEKRKAIAEKYEKLIAREENDSPERASLIAERKKELDDLDSELMDSSELWNKLFSDFSNRSSSSIRSVVQDIQELIDYMNGIDGAEMPDLFKDNKKTVEAINAAMSNPESLEKFTSNLSATVKKFKKMLDEENPFKQIAEGFKNKDSESMVKGLQGIASAADELGSVLEDLGMKSDSAVGKAVSVLGDTASYAAQGASVGGPWGAVIGGAIGMAKGLVAVFGADYSAYNKMKDEYESLIDVWDTLINKKQKYIDISYGDEARKTGSEIQELIGKKIQSNRELGIELLNAGSSAGSHSIGVRQRKNMSEQGWIELQKAASSIGFSYSSVADARMTGLFDLTAEQLSKLQDEAPTFWAKLDDGVREYLQNIIGCNGELEEMKDKLNETMTGVSFDSFYENFVSVISDMDKSGKDMADDFGEYLKNAILSNLLANKYRSRIEDLYNDWAAKSDSDGNGVFDLTSEEASELQKAQRELADEIIRERDEMAKVFGWGSSGTNQSASSKGFESMSQDTAEELNGRFTALYESNIRVESSIVDLKGSAIELLAVNSSQRDIADETRSILAQSFLELQQIRENTGEIVAPIKNVSLKIDRISKKMESL